MFQLYRWGKWGREKWYLYQGSKLGFEPKQCQPTVSALTYYTMCSSLQASIPCLWANINMLEEQTIGTTQDFLVVFLLTHVLWRKLPNFSQDPSSSYLFILEVKSFFLRSKTVFPCFILSSCWLFISSTIELHTNESSPFLLRKRGGRGITSDPQVTLWSLFIM